MPKTTMLCKEDMSEAQSECYDFLCDLFFGEHNLRDIGTVSGWGNGISMTASVGGLSTWDYNMLTRAVLMAHDRCIRFDVQPCTPKLLRLVLHRRQREGGVSQRHPTIDEAIERYRRTEPSGRE
jgi:hypothetical protein